MKNSISGRQKQYMAQLLQAMLWSKRGKFISLSGVGWNFLFFLLYQDTVLAVSTITCVLAALLCDYADKRAQALWTKVCPCEGCQARRARETAGQ